MRNYTYHSRIITELYCSDAMSKCEIVTIHYDGGITSHKMWVTKRQFEAALDGDQGVKQAIEWAYEDLVSTGRI